MAIENCSCGGNNIDKFYSLFTCDRANCNECHWTNNKCCNGSSNNANDDINDCSSECINFYNIPQEKMIVSKIKSFGFCKTHINEETNEIFGALAVTYTDGTKKLYLNVNKEVYDSLKNANKDYLYINLSQNVCNETNQCIIIT